MHIVKVEDALSALRTIRSTVTHLTMSRRDIESFLHTIIAQAEQIKRLQGALHKADGWGVDVITNLIESEYITEEDMQ